MGRGQIAEDQLSFNSLDRDAGTPKRDLSVEEIDELDALGQDVHLSRGREQSDFRSVENLADSSIKTTPARNQMNFDNSAELPVPDSGVGESGGGRALRKRKTN